VQTLDLQGSVDAWKGRWSLRGQYGWSHVSNGVFDTVTESTSTSTSSIFGDFDFINLQTEEDAVASRRDGGYLQLSYRGTGWASDFLNRLELIARADHTSMSGGRVTFRNTLSDEFGTSNFTNTFNDAGVFRDRFTVGVDYWLGDYTVLKFAYEHDHEHLFRDSNIIEIGFSTGL
jgi:hypothetical protein